MLRAPIKRRVLALAGDLGEMALGRWGMGALGFIDILLWGGNCCEVGEKYCCTCGRLGRRNDSPEGSDRELGLAEMSSALASLG